ncbi:proteasome inhibitor PI31 subunit-like [Epargyreus clarus]|uniref:proteasome inhibitor PI31 subunit-like n=1 Tax=Epargyreus clarus TaxID=520877 RepID=UPI003C2CC496
MASNPLYGWDLTFKTVERDIKRKSDVLMAFVHWNLTKKGFRNVGVGDESTLTGHEEKSELLPTAWNENENYVLRYVLDDKLYILHGLNSDGSLIINLMKTDDLAVTNVALSIEGTVNELSGPIDKLMPNHKEVMYNLIRDLINPITNRSTTSAQTQTPNQGNIPHDDPLRIPSRSSMIPRPDSHNLWDLPPAHMPNIGRSDLDPFAPVGSGGMLFNPFQPRRDLENPGLGIPGGLPRGSVPPGARFDPFGPPGGPMPGRRPPPPDADHLPPPGFNDNMFM